MPRHVAFLRAINVGGHTVRMDRLRTLFEGLGVQHVETFIASGNVIFESRAKDLDKLQRQIEGRLQESLDYEVVTMLRTDAEVEAISRLRPFKEADIASARAFWVGLLSAPLRTEQKTALMALETDIDEFHVRGREVYWLCKRTQSGSTFSNAVFEKNVKVRVTFRSMSTIRRLAAKLGDTGG